MAKKRKLTQGTCWKTSLEDKPRPEWPKVSSATNDNTLIHVQRKLLNDVKEASAAAVKPNWYPVFPLSDHGLRS